jgi:hypothetical protein
MSGDEIVGRLLIGEVSPPRGGLPALHPLPERHVVELKKKNKVNDGTLKQGMSG